MIGILKTLAEVDKAKLNPTDRLLVVAIYTMTNQDGIAWPGIKFLAKAAGLKDRALQYRLRHLEELGILEASPRFGENGRQTSNEYRLQEDALVSNCTGEGATSCTGSPPSSCTGEGATSCTPSNEGTKKEGSKRRDPSISAKADLALKVQEIYEAYPRKVGAKAAVKAIEKALKEIDADVLLERVKTYASTVKGEEKKFIPHPLTWFNQGRWEDEEVKADGRPDLLGVIHPRLPFLIGHRVTVIDSKITSAEVDRLAELMPHDLVVNGDQVAATAYDNRIDGAGFYRPGWIAWRKEHPHLLLDK